MSENQFIEGLAIINEIASSSGFRQIIEFFSKRFVDDQSASFDCRTLHQEYVQTMLAEVEDKLTSRGLSFDFMKSNMDSFLKNSNVSSATQTPEARALEILFTMCDMEKFKAMISNGCASSSGHTLLRSGKRPRSWSGPVASLLDSFEGGQALSFFRFVGERDKFEDALDEQSRAEPSNARQNGVMNGESVPWEFSFTDDMAEASYPLRWEPDSLNSPPSVPFERPRSLTFFKPSLAAVWPSACGGASLWGFSGVSC